MPLPTGIQGRNDIVKTFTAKVVGESSKHEVAGIKRTRIDLHEVAGVKLDPLRKVSLASAPHGAATGAITPRDTYTLPAPGRRTANGTRAG